MIYHLSKTNVKKKKFLKAKKPMKLRQTIIKLKSYQFIHSCNLSSNVYPCTLFMKHFNTVLLRHKSVNCNLIRECTLLNVLQVTNTIGKGSELRKYRTKEFFITT